MKSYVSSPRAAQPDHQHPPRPAVVREPDERVAYVLDRNRARIRGLDRALLGTLQRSEAHHPAGALVDHQDAPVARCPVEDDPWPGCRTRRTDRQYGDDR